MATYLEQLVTARDRILAGLVAAPGLGEGVVKYTLDGEGYEVKQSEAADTLEKLDNLIRKEQTRVPSRTEVPVVGRWIAGRVRG
jgi:hypothetical protein